MSAAADFTLSSTGLDNINTLLAEEANRIGSDIYKATLHTSPWMDLIKKSAFPDEMGYQLTSLVYDRSIPHTNDNGSSAGVLWQDVAVAQASANAFGTTSKVLGEQNIEDAVTDFQGGRGASGTTNRAYVQFSKKMKQYNLKKASIESPNIGLDDLRFAAQRQSQLSAIMDLMAESTRYTWENRYRDEFDRLSANVVPCLSASTKILSTIDADTDSTADDLFEGKNVADLDFATSGASNSDVTPTANISNAVLDKIYYSLIRKGAGNNAYGRENGRPVFALVCSSEASYQLQTEAGFRDDVRYNAAKVSDLIAPLGIEKSFRGFYHLVDDLAPRFSISGSTTTRVDPYTISGGITSVNGSYDDAEYEVAYVLHPEVMESQIPNPFTGGNGISFDATQYTGDFKWLNIPDRNTNPDGSIGFFRGVLASASKPIKTDFGYAIIFKRTSSTPAAV
tara:strand:+ start:4822 stop:6177 length:1356 start_codon:yes stop_codon:yes gene_type:complete